MFSHERDILPWAKLTFLPFYYAEFFEICFQNALNFLATKQFTTLPIRISDYIFLGNPILW